MNVAALQTLDPEIGRTVVADGIRTNIHDVGEGNPVLMIHGSGPGVSAWSNWRLNLPVLARTMRVIAPDCVGFGFTDRPDGIRYNRETWLRHLLGVMDECGVEQADVVGNSFGGGMALGLAIHHPERVRRLVLMGSVGIGFELTPGLEAVWGYTPSLEKMRELLDVFALRSRASDGRTRQGPLPGSHAAGRRRGFLLDVPRPAAAVDRGALPRRIRHRAAAEPDADPAWARGQGHPAFKRATPVRPHSRSRAAHVRSIRALDSNRAQGPLQRAVGRFPELACVICL